MNCQFSMDQRRRHTNIAACLLAMPDMIAQQHLQRLAGIDRCIAAGIESALIQLRHNLLEV